MFELNPENRISAEAALKDPWFEGQLSDRPVKKYILMNLEKFYVVLMFLFFSMKANCRVQ
jgi:hypothetical protein